VRLVRGPRKSHSERDFVKGFRYFLFAVLSWFMLSTVGELIGNEASETQIGRRIGQVALAVAVIALPLILATWLVLSIRARKNEHEHLPERPVLQLDPPPEPPWQRPGPLYDRDFELSQAIRLVLTHGVVVVAGPRDIGTSAVAQAVAQVLIDRHGGHEDRTAIFDLRGRSTRGPEDARATAGRILSSFGLDEPADDAPAVLTNAARRLIRLLGKHYDILVLDNVSVPEEVAWLVREWRAGFRVRLVLAGESAIGELARDRTVLVSELGLAGLRAIWDAEFAKSGLHVPGWIAALFPGGRESRTGTTDDVDELLREGCFGRPGAVKALAQEIRADNTDAVRSLLDRIRATGPVGGELERVWTAILEHIRDGLSPAAVWLLQALAELPVTALTQDAIAALLVARTTDEETDPLAELRVRNLVLDTGGRYRMPTEIRRVILRTTKEPELRKAAIEAVPVLLRHHVDQLDQWSGMLRAGADARFWLHDAERSLRPLFDEGIYPDEALLKEVMAYLPRIADALEAWYVREQQSSGLLTVNKGLYALAERAHRPDLASLAAIRMATAHRMAGRPGDATGMLAIAAGLTAQLRDNRTVAELQLREHVERALLGLTGPGERDDQALRRAENELNRILSSRRTRPRALGLSTVLINIGALCVQQGRAADALTHLRRAEKAAREAGDIGSEAQAIELQGVATAQLHDGLPGAVELWQRAKERFVRIGEEQGTARCLQHLGSAALVDGRIAGQLRDGRLVPLDDRAAAAVALPLLVESKRLREGQPDTGLVDEYLARARAQLQLPDED
jgi:hypothetical protein